MHCYFNVFQHLFNSLNKLCVSICVVHRWGSSELECRRVKRFCLFFRTLQISNFFVLYERLSYASSNEYHVPSSHLKMVVWQCWYWVQLYQSGKRKFHMVLFPAHFTKPLIIPILSIAPISYYIQGQHTGFTWNNTHGSGVCNLYDIPASSCHAEGCPAPNGSPLLLFDWLLYSLSLSELHFKMLPFINYVRQALTHYL